MNNKDTQKRKLLPIALSMAFFIPYSMYMGTKEKAKSEQNNIISDKNTAPKTSDEINNQQKTNINKENINSTSKIISTIKAKNFIVHIDSLGRISKFLLTENIYKTDKQEALNLINYNASPKPLELRFSNKEINNKAFNIPYVANKQEDTSLQDGAKSTTIILKQKINDDFEITKNITFFNDGHFDIDINLSPTKMPEIFFISTGMRPHVENDQFVFKGALIQEKDGTLSKIEDGDAEQTQSFSKASLVANSDRYYTSALYGKDKLDVVISSDKDNKPIPFVQSNKNISLSGYIGPKNHRVLKRIDENLVNIVEYGFITFFAKVLFVLLDFIYQKVNNWGWAIVILTIIIRIILYPLTYKGMVSMQKLKELAPKIKEIQAKHKGDTQAMQVQMMNLYKKHKANPMGGCLPLILQIPVFFAIYRVLYNAIELKGAEWIFWINDLSVLDPYFVLPILMGGTMYIQQKLTPNTIADATQRKIFTYLPVIFTVFFATFPAGLVLYWATSNVLSILQQYIINKIMSKK